MNNKKIVFIAFAIEDEGQRNLMKGQSLHTRTPFEYIDMSVKEAYESDWEEKVLTRIRRSHGVILLVSRNSLNSSGQKLEYKLAKQEGKKVIGIWAYGNDRTEPVFMQGTRIIPWSWDGIAAFIDSL